MSRRSPRITRIKQLLKLLPNSVLGNQIAVVLKPPNQHMRELQPSHVARVARTVFLDGPDGRRVGEFFEGIVGPEDHVDEAE